MSEHKVKVDMLLGVAMRRLALRAIQLLALTAGSAVFARATGPTMTVAATALVVLSCAVGGLDALVAQVVIHACAHPGSLSGVPRVDRWIGRIFCAEQLMEYSLYTLLHRYHHRFTNSVTLDPNAVRPGEAWWHFMLTLHSRQLRFMERPDFQEKLRHLRGHDARREPASPASALSPFTWVRRNPITARNVATIAICGAAAAWFRGAEGALLLLIGWLAPVMIGQILIADFAWRSHLRLPPRAACCPYRGQDTAELREGLIYRLLNFLTFDFYDHRVHHVRPRLSMWAPKQAAAAVL